MKFINYLSGISGIEVYPLAALLLFVTAFVVVAVFALTVDRRRMDEYNAMPLEDTPSPATERSGGL